MKRAHRKHHGKSATEMIEEATHLLRTGPTAALAYYYLGTVPFVLGLLFFWADMSRNPYAPQRLAGAALGMAVLFVWMKFWHVVFARKLRAFISGEASPAWNFARVRRIVVAQTVWQPIGLVAFPIAAVLTLPAVWTYAFFQNVTALNDGEETSLRVLAKRSLRLAALWPGQNHVALILLSLFALIVGLGWTALCMLLPSLGKMLLGIESVFTLSGSKLFNTTFLTAMVGLTYLSVDPLFKAVCVLRCFYGESLQSGDDLRAELRGFTLRPVAVLLLAGTIFLSAISAPGQESTPAAPPAPAPGPSSVEPSELDRAIDDVIHKRKYTWRSPREKVPETEQAAGEKGAIARFFERAGEWTKERLKAAAEWLGNILQKIFGRTRRAGTPSTGISWDQIRGMLIMLLALAIGLTVFFLIRMWRTKSRRPPVVETEALKPVPDLTDENVSAEQLPEDEWTKLARELLERGELRLALRAFYLSSLAHLAQRNLISLAKFKSNREYERELGRRGHSFPTLLTTFGENLYTFDRTWYGLHEATRDVVQQFAANVDKIKAGG